MTTDRPSAQIFPAVSGVSNLRDLGGLPAGEGLSVRAGVIYRSAHLSGLSDAGRAAFDLLGLTDICDLRSEAERLERPTRIDGYEGYMHHIPIEPSVKARLDALTGNRPVDDTPAHDLMVETYRALVADHASQFRQVIEVVLYARGPVLIHCTAGKDRTGLAVAALLTLLGVGREPCLADYLLTNRFWHGTGKLSSCPPEVAAALTEARPAYLDAAFEAWPRGCADVADWLGISSTALAICRDRLLAPV